MEFAVVEKKVFDGLKTGSEVLKQIQKEMSIEAVEELLSDTREAVEYQQVCVYTHRNVQNLPRFL